MNKIKSLWLKFRIWVNTPPDENDNFFVTLRVFKQNVFPCNHEWFKTDTFHRKCDICSKRQVLTSRLTARHTWKTIP